MKHKQLTGIFLVLCIIIMSACSDRGASPPDHGEESVLGQNRNASNGHSAFPLSIVDSAGRDVSLPVPPKRFVVVGQIGHGPYMVAHLLYMFPETADRLVGLEERDRSSAFLPLIDPRFSEKKILQINAGSEQIAALKPDVVFMKNNVVDAMATVLNQVSIPFVYLGLEDPEQFLHEVSIVGDILEDKARAEKISDFYRSRLETVRNRLKAVREEEKPRVLVLGYNARGGASAVQVPASSWMQTFQTITTGGRPVWVDKNRMTNGWTIVSFEQIAAWNPDKIFLGVWYRESAANIISKLKADPRWSKLKAVKNDDLHAYPSDLFPWDTPGPRWILGTMWMATKTWPDLFGDIDMRQEVYRFFEELFFMPRDKIDKEIIPRVFNAAGNIHD